MDEPIICSMNCQKKAIYACDCSDKKVLLCSKHTGPHGALNGDHHFIIIIKFPDPQTKIIVSKLLKGIKQKTKQDRKKIIQESSLFIKQINEATAKSLEKLLIIEKIADEYLSLCETLEKINNLNSKSFIESLLTLSAEEAAKLKFQDEIVKINNFKENIKNLFIIQETNSLFNIDSFRVYKPHFLKYFKDNDLFAFDVKSQKLIPQNINKNFPLGNPTCLLEDASLFCCINQETFIITPNNSIIALNSYHQSDRSGLIAVNDFVFIFGGIGRASSKFSLKSKNWNTLAEYPVSINCYISCACLNNVILIGGYESTFIHGYNILNNSFTKELITLKLCRNDMEIQFSGKDLKHF